MFEKNDFPIKDVLKKWVNTQQGAERKLNQVKVEEVWVELMGAKISEYTSKVILRRDILILYINSAPLKQELSYSKDKIVRRMNEKLGEDIIKEVIVK